jgi:hypothetical protein
MPRNIVVFSDGTSQDGGARPEQRRSNVYKYYSAQGPTADRRRNSLRLFTIVGSRCRAWSHSCDSQAAAHSAPPGVAVVLIHRQTEHRGG